MALPSLRKFDVQAKCSFYMSLAAILPLAAAAMASISRYSHQLRAIQYGEAGMFKVGFMFCIGTACALGVVGIVLGFNSAGQRRNKESTKSWMGFFIGTAVLSLAVVLFYAFRQLRFQSAA